MAFQQKYASLLVSTHKLSHLCCTNIYFPFSLKTSIIEKNTALLLNKLPPRFGVSSLRCGLGKKIIAAIT